MSTFRRDDKGEIRAIFTSHEALVIKNLTEQLIELLGESQFHTDSTDSELDPFMNLMGISGSDAPPDDPVLRRLLPDGYKEPEAAAEFRRYTEHSLREKKRAHAYLIHEAITSSEEENEVVVSSQEEMSLATIEIPIRFEDVDNWLGGLNDLRLALAVRLGIGDVAGEKSEDRDRKFELMREGDPMQAVYAVYSWLGWLQQSLIELWMGSGDGHQAT